MKKKTKKRNKIKKGVYVTQRLTSEETIKKKKTKILRTVVHFEKFQL